MKIIQTQQYKKRAKKFLKKHPQIASQYKKTISLMLSNMQHPSLRLHKIKGRQKDFYSVSINISYRITIDFLIEEDTIIPIDVGSHDEVY